MRERLGQKGSRRWAGDRRTEPRAPAYNELKAQHVAAVVAKLREVGWAPFTPPVQIELCMHEPDRRRDPDGVFCGALKIVMDGIVAAKLLPNDTHRYVYGFGTWASGFLFKGDAGYSGPGVALYVWSKHNEQLQPLFFGWRFPDFNELLAAREVGARRHVRKNGGA